MTELEADPAYRQRIAERDALHRQRVAENADEFALVRQALDLAGLPSEDFGRFTSGRHPDVIRPSIFDYRGAVPVLLDVLPQLTRPVVKEAVVRSLSTAHARPAAATALLEEFRRTADAQHPALKWAIGNALSTVTTTEHADALLEFVRDRSHGAGRQMIVDRLARFSKDDRIVPTLQSLLEDEDVALHAMAGLRLRLGPAEALEHIRPLTSHPSERVRRAAAAAGAPRREVSGSTPEVSTDRETFVEQRRRIIQRGTPSGGDDLLGMEMDFHAYLSMLDEIDDDSVSARRTGDVQRLIAGSCSPAEGVTLDAAAEAVRTAWLESLRYEFIEAHYLELDADPASLEVVTQTAPDGLYVTAVIEIRLSRPSSRVT